MDKYEILKRYYGYESFRKGQEEIIDAILSGCDVLAVMPTGAGKSICYQVPALMLPGITLVVSPLISLMQDQVQALNQAGISAAYINSSLTEQQILLALKYAAMGKYKIIYVAPERLLTSSFLYFAQRTSISMLTVDEAHCISQWGQDFRPSYLKIVEFAQKLGTRPVISAFTATATEQVREDIKKVLHLLPKVFVTGFDRENLYFAVERPRKKEDYILNYIRDHKGESGIIYCATRKNVDNLFQLLDKEGISVTRYHAGLSNEERQRAQEDFIYDRKLVMAATNAFGMGIDKSNVRYVLHYNMPQSIENYYQEAGRAGRDGERSECILFYSAQDIMVNRYLLQSKEDREDITEAEKAAVHERDERRLQEMSYYCLTTDCLRNYLLGYFGEERKEPCLACSNCRTEFEEMDVTHAAEMVLSCVRELRQRYGINVVAGTLAGSTRAKLKEYGAENLETYGSLKEMTEEEIKQIINRMLIEGLLYATADKYSVLKISPEADRRDFLSRRVILKKPKHVPTEDDRQQKKKTVSEKARKSDVLNSRGLDLFEELRKLRSKIAKEEGMPPYIIFSDKSLVDMCARAPFTKKEMLEISGVGAHKLEKYGERFLQAIQDFTGGVREKFYFGEEQKEVFRGTSQEEREEDGWQPSESSFYTEAVSQPPLKVIAYVYTDFPEKFGIPRQSGLIEELKGRVVFEPEYRHPDAVKGLEDFDYIWLLWQFEGADRKNWSATVKPPRLGGNTHMGVFATRSPFRPNPIGLSSVKLERIEMTEEGPVLHILGADIKNKTPVYDIKPYLSYADSHPLAREGFAGAVKGHELKVDFPQGLLEIFPEEKRSAVVAVLKQDPRPSYHNDPQRKYGVAFAGYDVHFTVEDDRLSVFEVVPYYGDF